MAEPAEPDDKGPRSPRGPVVTSPTGFSRFRGFTAGAAALADPEADVLHALEELRNLGPPTGYILRETGVLAAVKAVRDSSSQIEHRAAARSLVREWRAQLGVPRRPSAAPGGGAQAGGGEGPIPGAAPPGGDPALQGGVSVPDGSAAGFAIPSSAHGGHARGPEEENCTMTRFQYRIAISVWACRLPSSIRMPYTSGFQSPASECPAALCGPSCERRCPSMPQRSAFPSRARRRLHSPPQRLVVPGHKT